MPQVTQRLKNAKRWKAGTLAGAMAVIPCLTFWGCVPRPQAPLDHRNAVYDTLIHAQRRLRFCDNPDFVHGNPRLDCIKLFGSVTLGSNDTAVFSIYSFSPSCRQFCSGAYAVAIQRSDSSYTVMDITAMPVTDDVWIAQSDTSEYLILGRLLYEARHEWWQVMDGISNLGLGVDVKVGLFASLSRLSGGRTWSMRDSRQITYSDSAFVAKRLLKSPILNRSFYYIDSLEMSLMKAVQGNIGLDKYWLLPDSTIIYYNASTLAKAISPVYLFPEQVHNFIF